MQNGAGNHPSAYLDFYKYLPVLNEQQITKLRNVAIGLLRIDAFSEEERYVLESRLIVSEK